MQFLIILGVLALFPLISIYRGFVLCKLWVWFITPIFNCRPLTLAEAIGFSIVVYFLTPTNSQASKEKWDLKMKVQMALGPLIALGIGYVVHLFL